MHRVEIQIRGKIEVVGHDVERLLGSCCRFEAEASAQRVIDHRLDGLAGSAYLLLDALGDVGIESDDDRHGSMILSEPPGCQWPSGGRGRSPSRIVRRARTT